MGPYLETMLVSLTQLCNDASPLMEQRPIFLDIEVHRDEIYDELFREGGEEFDMLTLQALELLMHALLIILDRQCTDHLTGGKFSNPAPDLQNIMSKVPKTNRIGERDFGILDYLMRCKPNASMFVYDSIIMWANNDTKGWLEGKTSEERKQLMRCARVSAKGARMKFKQRKEAIAKDKLSRLNKKREEVKRAEKAHFDKVTRATANLDKFSGSVVWASNEVLDSELGKIGNETGRMQAVLAQLQFHQNVLKTEAPSYLYNQSKNKVKHSFETLLNNLREVINHNPT